jgi:superfamily I DNA/RNA helicase
MHQAKGEEFDAVIVGFVSRQAFRDNEDGRRLLYVAMTRARRLVTIVAPDAD